MLEMGRGSGHAWSRAEGPPTPAALSPLGGGPHPQGVRWGSVIAGRALASDRHSGMGAPRPPASSPRERQRGPWTPCSRWASPSWELHTVGRKGAPGSGGRRDGCYPSVEFANDPRLGLPRGGFGALGPKKTFVLSFSWLLKQVQIC